MEQVRKTALYEAHIAAGGKIIDFAGWALPVQYEGIIEEHEAVRQTAGMFDVSHMGEVEVRGKDAMAFVQNLVTNDVGVLKENQVQYAMMCYEHGGVVDDLLVYKYADNHFFLVINASNVEKDYAWMVEQVAGYEVKLTNLSDRYSEIAIQGPRAQEILQQCTQKKLEDLQFFFFDGEVRIGNAMCIVSRTGYTGEDGFEIYMANDDAMAVWNTLLKAGEPLGLKPAGLGCRDTLRFEATLPLYGNEIDKDISPLEAGYGFCVKLGKEKFIGQAALVAQKADGLKRKIVGFEMEKGIPRHGYPVFVGDREIGHVTTGYFSPTLKKNIGLALIDASHGEMGSPLLIQVRKKTFEAKVISKKFYQKQYKPKVNA